MGEDAEHGMGPWGKAVEGIPREEDPKLEVDLSREEADGDRWSLEARVKQTRKEKGREGVRVKRKGVRKERTESWERRELKKKDGRPEGRWEGERRKPGHD